MSVQPVSQSESGFVGILRKTLPTDIVGKIFKERILRCRSFQLEDAATLRLVCKLWKQIIDTPEMLMKVSRRLSFPISKTMKNELTWETLMRCFKQGDFLDTDVQVNTFSYSSQLDIKAFAWIGDRGFVSYMLGECTFTVCMLAHPEDLSTIQFPDRLTTVVATDDLIICGVGNGRIMIYSLEKSQFVFDRTAHEDPITFLHPYGHGLISVSSRKIFLWNHDYEPTELPSPAHMENGNLEIEECCLCRHYLFLKLAVSEKLDSYVLDLNCRDLEWRKIPDFPQDTASYFSHAQVWGDKMCRVRYNSNANNYLIVQFPFDVSFFFDGVPSKDTVDVKEILWNPAEANNCAFDCFCFRGDKGFLVTSFEDDGQKWFYIHYFNFTENKIETFYVDRDATAFSLKGNRLFYILPKKHEVVSWNHGR